MATDHRSNRAAMSRDSVPETSFTWVDAAVTAVDTLVTLLERGQASLNAERAKGVVACFKAVADGDEFVSGLVRGYAAGRHFDRLFSVNPDPTRFNASGTPQADEIGDAADQSLLRTDAARAFAFLSARSRLALAAVGSESEADFAVATLPSERVETQTSAASADTESRPSSSWLVVRGQALEGFKSFVDSLVAGSKTVSQRGSKVLAGLRWDPMKGVAIPTFAGMTPSVLGSNEEGFESTAQTEWRVDLGSIKIRLVYVPSESLLRVLDLPDPLPGGVFVLCPTHGWFVWSESEKGVAELAIDVEADTAVTDAEARDLVVLTGLKLRQAIAEIADGELEDFVQSARSFLERTELD